MSTYKQFIYSAFLSTLWGAAQVNAQCQWEWFGESHYPGVLGPVSALVRWDPDGVGPLPELLVVGGKFLVAGDAIAHNIATWDGQDWEPLGQGMNDEVLALTVHDGKLFAAGRFTLAGGAPANYIAEWDDGTWHALGVGTDAPVAALASFNGELWAGGHFSFAGNMGSQGVARWDGVQWLAMGNVFNVSPSGNAVRTMVPFGTDLIVGGDFTKAGYLGVQRVALWNGTQWSNMGTGLNARVNSLAVHGGELFAGGLFTASGSTEMASVAKWDGNQWAQVGAGLTGNQGAGVLSLAEFGGELVAVGNFASSGATQLPGTATWDGQSWYAIPGGLSGSRRALQFGAELTVATPSGVRSWTGLEWKRFGIGIGNNVKIVAPYKAGIAIGGDLRLTGSIGEDALLKTGDVWNPLGTGPDGQTYALQEFEGDLIAGGSFSHAGSAPAFGVKRWDGATWTPMGHGLRSVNALTLYRGRLIAGGSFYSPGFLPPYRIAQWNGTAWESMGAGIDDNSSTEAVYALTEFEGDLVAGGYFDESGGTTTKGVARWNGTNWLPFGNGLSSVLAVAAYRGELFAAGRFSFISGQGSVGAIARWNGSQWVPVGAGVDGDIEAMIVFNGDLIVGGQFNTAGGIASINTARWDGNAWHELGPVGAEFGIVQSLAVVNGALVVGGQFNTAADKVAINVARFARTTKLGDSDGNDAVELSDFLEFSLCFSGVENPGMTPYPTAECFCTFNSDGDSDIDMVDFAAMQRAFDQ